MGKNSVQVKTYKNEKEYQKDCEKMLKSGWSVAAQAGKDQKTAIGRTAGKAVLTGGLGLMIGGRAKKGDTLTVTYTR